MLHFMITVRIPLLHPVVLMYSSTRIESRGLASCTRSSVYAAAPTQYYRHCLVYTSCIVAWGNGRVNRYRPAAVLNIRIIMTQGSFGTSMLQV